MHSSTAKSPLSKYLQPIPQKSTGKLGHARVLTSNECLQLLEEKKRKREREVEEKEERRNERERRKIEREKLQKKKKEECLERQKKKQEEARKKQPRRRGCPRSSNPASRSGSLKTCDPGTESVQGTTSVGEPTQHDFTHGPETPTGGTNSGEFALHKGEWECAFCYESYCSDGEEWLKCACSQWVHEKCIEDVYFDENHEERFCPFCLN